MKKLEWSSLTPSLLLPASSENVRSKFMAKLTPGTFAFLCRKQEESSEVDLLKSGYV